MAYVRKMSRRSEEIVNCWIKKQGKRQKSTLFSVATSMQNRYDSSVLRETHTVGWVLHRHAYNESWKKMTCLGQKNEQPEVAEEKREERTVNPMGRY